MTKTLQDLMNKAKEMDNSLPIMEGREKGEMSRLTDGTTFTIHGFGFLTDPKKGNEYAVFVVAEDPKNFYFGGKVLTDALKKFEDEGYKDVIETEGLKVAFGSKKSGSGDMYTTVKFFPDSE